MDNQDKPKFLQLLAGTSEVYGKPISTAGQIVWWASLRGYELRDVVRAFSRHTNDPERGQFIPKPADIVLQIGNKPKPERRLLEDSRPLSEAEIVEGKRRMRLLVGAIGQGKPAMDELAAEFAASDVEIGR